VIHLLRGTTVIKLPWTLHEECTNSITIRDAVGDAVAEVTSPTDENTEREREIARTICEAVNSI
jgi:hypothetical protein